MQNISLYNTIRQDKEIYDLFTKLIDLTWQKYFHAIKHSETTVELLTISECVEQYHLSEYMVRKLVTNKTVLSKRLSNCKNSKIYVVKSSLESYLYNGHL